MEGRPSLRPEAPSDAAFSLRVFASTRAHEVACLAGVPGAAETFVRLQHQAQQRAYQADHPAADRSILLVDGAPAGRLVVDRSGEEIRVVDIALLPEHRGRGAGTVILTALLDEARLLGRPVRLHVWRTSPAARLYARLGFTRTGGTETHDAMEWLPA